MSAHRDPGESVVRRDFRYVVDCLFAATASSALATCDGIPDWLLWPCSEVWFWWAMFAASMFCAVLTPIEILLRPKGSRA